MEGDTEFLDEIAAADGKVIDRFQRAAITKTDNTVVAAGAGSGKTEVLALRYTYLLCTDDALRVKNILALTFTKKAAGEIYERIHQKLSRAASPEIAAHWPDAARRARRALAEFADAKIQTLDSYAGTIVRQTAGLYGVRPDFTTGASSDKTAEDLALPFVLEHRDDACFNVYGAAGKIEDLARDYFANPVQKCTSVATDAGYFTRGFREQQREVLEEWNKAFCGTGGLVSRVRDVRDLVRAAEDGPGVKKADKYVSAAKSALAALPDEGFAPAESFAAEGFANEAARRGEYFDGVKALTSISRGLGAKSGVVKELKDAVKGLAAAANELSPLFDFVATYAAQKRMFALMDGFLEEVNNRKRLTGALSFKDVNDLALRALIEQPDIRREQKTLIKKIMIDEFQDNNSKNKNFLFLIAERDGAELERGERSEAEFFRELSNNIAPDKLFFVGDEKQSIYKFRGADVAVFNELKDSLRDRSGASETVKLSMTNNYRSSAALLYSFNRMFGNNEAPGGDDEIPSVFYDEDTAASHYTEQTTGKGAPPAESASAASGEAPGARPAPDAATSLPVPAAQGAAPRGVPRPKYEAYYDSPATKEGTDIAPVDGGSVRAHLCLFAKSAADGKAPDVLDADETLAYFIARRIHELHDALDDPWSGYAVLERSRTKTRTHLQRYLSQFDIPYVLDRQTGVFSDGIVNDFYNFLRLCVYPADSNAFAAVLASPFANISIQGIENILAACTGRDGGFTPFVEDGRLALSASDAEKYSAVKALYEEQRGNVLSQDITSSLEYLWSDTGYRYETLLSENLNMRAEQYDLLYEAARQADADDRSVSWFVDQLGLAKRREIGARDADDEELGLGDVTYPLERPSAVQIMTVHQSKGLEFKHVFVTGLEGVVKADKCGCVFYDDEPFPPFDESAGVALRAQGAAAPWFYARRKDDATRREEAERKRLIYVAVTRAIDDVYIACASGPRNASSLLNKLARYYYKDELGKDASDSEKTDTSASPGGSAPAVYRDGAPFDFIRIAPISTRVRSRGGAPLDRVRREKIAAQEAAYEREPVSFEEFYDRTATPSSLESAESTATVTVPAGLSRGAAYEKLDGILAAAPDEGGASEGARNGITAADFGDIVHAFMETLVRTGSLSRAEANIKSELRLRLNDAGVTPAKDKAALLECARSMCERFKACALYKAARDAAGAGRLCKAESGFKMLLEGGVVLTGTIDLIYEGADGAPVIVDYKTDRALNPAKYIAQQACYRCAAAEIYGVPVDRIKTYLYYTQYGAALDITPYTADLPSSRA